MHSYSLIIHWAHGGSSHQRLRSHTLTQAKKEAAAMLLEDDVYNVRSAQLSGDGMACTLDTHGLTRGHAHWTMCRHNWAA